MLKTLIRPAMIFIPLGIGMCLPQLHQYAFMLRWLLMVMLFFVFLKLDLKDLKFRRSHFLLLAANLLIGTGAFLITLYATGNTSLAQAAFFTGITPTATAASVVMGFMRGNVGYMVTSFVTTNIGISLALPLLLSWVCGNSSANFMLRVLESLIFLLAIPALAAFILRKLHPDSRKWPAGLAMFNFSLWSVGLLIMAGSAAEFFRINPEFSPWIIAETAMISLLLCIFNFTAGYFLGEKELRHETSQSLGQKNTTLTVYLALIYAGPLAAIGVISYVFWHNTYNAIQLYIFDRRKQLEEKSKNQEA